MENFEEWAPVWQSNKKTSIYICINCSILWGKIEDEDAPVKRSYKKRKREKERTVFFNKQKKGKGKELNFGVIGSIRFGINLS